MRAKNISEYNKIDHNMSLIADFMRAMESACALLVKQQIERQIAALQMPAFVLVKKERDEDEKSRDSDVQIIEGKNKPKTQKVSRFYSVSFSDENEATASSLIGPMTSNNDVPNENVDPTAEQHDPLGGL